MLKDRLLAFLQATCSGRKNRMSGARLAKVFGISVTALRKLINQLRREHHPICSDRYGYFYAVTASEVYGTISHLYAGKVLVLSPDTLRESCWSQENQLWYHQPGWIPGVQK